ncbi:WD40-repeat-containing domain protein [Suillus variegatus]|nr:WD40-repeat-containing domain protein [Suillus variegatus]
MSGLIPIVTPVRRFRGHEGYIYAVAVLPDKRRMVTGSDDMTLRLWDLKTGVVLKKMEGHRNGLMRLAVSRDGQLIASGDRGGEVIVWHGETGELLTKIEAHSETVHSLDFSPDGTVLATGSYYDTMMKLWNTQTWQLQGNPIEGGDHVNCVRYSPSGELTVSIRPQPPMNSFIQDSAIDLSLDSQQHYAHLLVFPQCYDSFIPAPHLPISALLDFTNLEGIEEAGRGK